jgi:hypothetical protein
MKSILKPTQAKIVFAVVLLIISSWLWRFLVVSRVSDTFPIGFPFQFYLAWGPCPPGETCAEFNGWYLIFDIVIWYLVSAFVLKRMRGEGG